MRLLLLPRRYAFDGSALLLTTLHFASPRTALRRHGVDGNTRANLYFGLPELGAKAVDGRTPSDPNGLTSVTGKWADAFQQRLERVSLTCKVQFERDFRRAQLEKLIWISAFNLIGSVHGNVTMGQVASKHQSEVEEMVQEMGTMIRFTLAVGMGTGIEARLVDYARAVKDFPTSFKEFEWRNGFFYHYSKCVPDAWGQGWGEGRSCSRCALTMILSCVHLATQAGKIERPAGPDADAHGIPGRRQSDGTHRLVSRQARCRERALNVDKLRRERHAQV